MAKWGAIAALALMAGACASSEEPQVTDLDKGLLMLKQGQFEEARTYYAAMAAREPQNPYVHLNLGASLDNLGRKTEAVEHYQHAISLGGDQPVHTIVYNGEEKSVNTDIATVAGENVSIIQTGAAASK